MAAIAVIGVAIPGFNILNVAILNTVPIMDTVVAVSFFKQCLYPYTFPFLCYVQQMYTVRLSFTVSYHYLPLR